MCIESWLWLIFPVIFLGMMVLCVSRAGKRGRRFCCTPFGYRYARDDRIRRLEDEIRRLKDERQ